MKYRVIVLLLGALVCAGAPAQTFIDLKGNWKGVWDIDGTTTLRFYLKITKSGTVYSGTMDDLDEGYNNMPAVGVTTSFPSVQFDFSNYGFVYQGNLNSNFTQITGTWSDGPDT